MIDEIRDQIDGATQEAELLQEYAEHLEAAAKSNDSEYKMLVLDENLKIWVAIDSSTKNPKHLLPQEIKTNLAKLSKYVEQVTISKGIDMSSSTYKSLADINRQISEGLMESVTANLAQQEAYYLAKCGLELSEAHKSKNDDQMVTALDNNQRLWVMIKTLMKSKTSRLPEETKNNLIKLADYVAQNTIKLGQDLNNIDNKMLDSFININRQIAEGLLGHR
jgi:flagellar biosynthesis regulator FlaF